MIIAIYLLCLYVVYM